MNVLHVIPRFLGGGPERHLLALAAAWREAGLRTNHQIAVLDVPVSAPLLVKARRLGLKLLVRPAPAELDDAIGAADVVEITFWNHPRLLDLLRRHLPPARIIVFSAVAGTAAPQVLIAPLGRFADAMVLSGAVSHSTPAAQALEAAGRPLTVLPALADMSRLDGFEPRSHAGIRVGYLGLVEPTKLHPRFAALCCAVRTPDVRFEVFGGGTWRTALQQQFEALGAGGRVRFHGHVEDLRAAFADLDIFGYPLAPSTYATSEKTVQEAMWAGIPPVLLAGTGATALVTHEETGLVCPNEADYAPAVERLAADPDLRRRLGAAARAAARKMFNPADNALRFRQVFEAAAAVPRRTRDPLPGAGQSPARRFVDSLGDCAGPFAISLDGAALHGETTVAAAHSAISNCSAVLARSEGGIIHYYNTYPDDPHLRAWSALIAAGPTAENGS